VLVANPRLFFSLSPSSSPILQHDFPSIVAALSRVRERPTLSVCRRPTLSARSTQKEEPATGSAASTRWTACAQIRCAANAVSVLLHQHLLQRRLLLLLLRPGHPRLLQRTTTTTADSSVLAAASRALPTCTWSKSRASNNRQTWDLVRPPLSPSPPSPPPHFFFSSSSIRHSPLCPSLFFLVILARPPRSCLVEPALSINRHSNTIHHFRGCTIPPTNSPTHSHVTHSPWKTRPGTESTAPSSGTTSSGGKRRRRGNVNTLCSGYPDPEECIYIIERAFLLQVEGGSGAVPPNTVILVNCSNRTSTSGSVTVVTEERCTYDAGGRLEDAPENCVVDE
jgi:hypothetical protein